MNHVNDLDSGDGFMSAYVCPAFSKFTFEVSAVHCVSVSLQGSFFFKKKTTHKNYGR